jgi:hypothetical protein
MMMENIVKFAEMYSVFKNGAKRLQLVVLAVDLFLRSLKKQLNFELASIF